MEGGNVEKQQLYPPEGQPRPGSVADSVNQRDYLWGVALDSRLALGTPCGDPASTFEVFAPRKRTKEELALPAAAAGCCRW